MKARKSISMLLSLLLVFNVFLNGSYKVKAEEIANSIQVLSVSVDKTNVDINKEVSVTVDAKSTAADLANEAYGVYVLKTDKGDIEKELVLTFDKNDLKYHGKISFSDESLVGLWKISWLTVSDVLGNTVAAYNSKVHENLGQDLSGGDFSFFVDKNGPTLSKINLSKHAAKAGDNIDISIDASDDISGLASEVSLVYVLKTASGDVEKEVTLSLKDNKYVGKFAINTTSYQEGLWQISYVVFNDNSSNSTIVYNSNVHENLGIDLKDGNLVVDYKSPDKPQISLSTEKPTKENVKVAITSEKDAKIEYKLEGQNEWTEYKGVFEVEKNTKVQARATDLAGNEGEPTEVVISNIDKVAPVVTIENLDKEYYKVDVTPSIKVDDSTATKVVLLNGVPYISGTAITSQGEYTLSVVATDNAENSTVVTKKFTIDKTAPMVIVQGVEDGKSYKTAEPKVTSNEENVDIKLFLNDNPYDGKAISKDGEYELQAVVTDRAGNPSTAKVKFVVDNVKPVISVGGVDSNIVYVNSSVTPNVQVNEVAKVTMTLDGVSYNGKDQIKGTGDHKLVITAVDNAGNETVKEITFTIKVVASKDNQTTADFIKDLVKNTKTNESVVVNANDNPSITTNVLEAVKGIDKPVSFTVESQGITLTWTFNGKDVTDTTKSVDLTLNAAAPNKDLITKVDVNSQIISFKNHGTLPAPMTITIPVDTKKFDVSKPINFYYYNETTKKAELIAENLKAYQKGEAYYVDVTITHCSDYFLSASDSKTVLPKVEKLVKTGSSVDMNVLVVLGIMLIGTGFVVVLSKRRRS